MIAHLGSKLAITSRFVPTSYGPEISSDADLNSYPDWVFGNGAAIAGGALVLGNTSGIGRFTWPEASVTGDVVQLRITLASLGSDFPLIQAGNAYLGFGTDVAPTAILAGLNTLQYTVGAGSPLPTLDIFGQVNGVGSVIESVSIRRVL